MHPFVDLAIKTIHSFVKENRKISLSEVNMTEEMKGRAGVFVSLKKHGNLRGCIGTFMPQKENIASEIIMNAISAATKDPRFTPLKPSELQELTYSVDVLSEPEPVVDIDELDPKIYGVIVSSGHKRGLLLPDIEGVDTVNDQLRIAKMKAGIALDEDVQLYRFTIKRYK